MVRPDQLELSTAGPSLGLASVDIPEDPRSRSPRTPVYQPTSPLSSSLWPFDPAKLFFNLSTPLTPNAVVPAKEGLPPPPNDPLAWVWQCHLCRSRWPLGVTRRCLVDGHFYCSGEPSQLNLKKRKKGQSCSSEFDYVGWKEYGFWRGSALKASSNRRILEGCESCEFPSQCRYKQMDDQANSSPMEGIAHTSTAPDDDIARYYSNENFTVNSILAKSDASGKSEHAKTGNLKQPRREEWRVTCGKAAKTAERRSDKKQRLSPIAEEAVRSDVDAGLQDLVMPLVVFWSNSKER